MNWAKELKAKNERTERRMLLLLGVDIDWLTRLRMDNMLDWLENEYGEGSYKDMIAAAPDFKTWWLAQWASRDQGLSDMVRVLNTGVMHVSISEESTQFIHEQCEFQDFYRMYHYPNMLKVWPDKEIIHDIIKAARKAA